ncbi:UvrD-helicase domain-containing protein [Suttonella sp. R2A3]|uniref:UvrD-helicase domain-containing protein n=1 Tax=Suttonella sp. R2A3 TaxID=2908648 RepID=UPI001F32D0EC|nr:UvrD-helicase domain-containing protein [Suttonella sp. R2A3]UJF24628.1 UvrD-helicase domain-containing protein [Suttonella sp. R2A3]
MTQIPALNIALKGKALIEASAGTGKTWTLSGILLRLLVEDKREPREIIATTFTRAAASEMQTRVAERLAHLRGLLVSIFLNYQQDNTFLGDDGLSARIEAYLDQLVLQAGDQQQAAEDHINRHLLINAANQGIHGLIEAYTYCSLALVDVDKLFIGTLDSLFQRWLRELALESGVSRIQINTETQALEQLTHHHLRQFYQQQARENPELLNHLDQKNTLALDKYTDTSKSALGYGYAPFLRVPKQDFDREVWRSSIDALQRFDENDVAELVMLLDDGKRQKWLSGRNGSLASYYHELPNLFCDAQQGLVVVTFKGLARNIINATDPESSVFNKAAPDDYRKRISEHRLLVTLRAFVEQQQQLEQAADILQAQSVIDNVQYVREHLPDVLQQAGETTFDALRDQLSAALHGKQGEALVAYIAQRYPVILVDEAQDLNAEQSALLERVYFRDNVSGFFLMVGDPKQAIYGFRGSDVANFRQLRNKIDPAQRYTLDTNFRSAHRLIEALNEAYAHTATDALGEDISYQKMQAKHSNDRLRAILNREGGNIQAPLLWLKSKDAGQALEQVLEVVQRLTDPHSQYIRQNEDGTLTTIRGQDILILASGNNKLKEIEALLNANHIATERQADHNLFEQTMAEELLALMQAMLSSEHSGLLRRVLCGPLYGLDYHELYALESDTSKHWRWDDLRQRFQEAGAIWREHGLLSALQSLLPQKNHLGRSVWTQLAAQQAPQCFRDLLDLRALQQVIADHEQRLRPRQFIDWWRERLDEPPNNEWALCPPLPGVDAVRLMTIHKAKGLQAPVVIVVAPNPSNRSNQFSVGTLHQDNTLYLSATPKDPRYAPQIEQEAKAEQQRLIYVSLTRAEDLLVVVYQDRSIDAITDLAATSEQASYALRADEETLAGCISQDQPLESNVAQEVVEPLLNPLQEPKASGWRKTSFSALNRLLVRDEALAVYDDRAFELHGETQEAAEYDNVALPFRFARGTEAGSFLHEVLEKVDGQYAAHWSVLLTRLLDKYHLLSMYESEITGLESWLKQLVDSRLIGGLSLAQLAKADQQRELGFSLSLNSRDRLPIREINALFAQWGKPVQLNANDQRLYGFLRGEIDLVYRHNGRYHVVDYKSNHLGYEASDYCEAKMIEAMDEHHYWLQAVIYQLALHRLLRTRLEGYDPEKHLGPAEYFFIRAAGADDPTLGHLRVDIPTELVVALDGLLAYRQAS